MVKFKAQGSGWNSSGSRVQRGTEEASLQYYSMKTGMAECWRGEAKSGGPKP